MDTSMSPYVSVIIVNYNSGNYALECIQSLLSQQDVRLEIIVVDNASKDDSVMLLQSQLPPTVALVESNENLGFGRANNLAVSKAHGDFVLLLNPDTQITDAHAIRKLVDKLSSNPNVGLLAPAVQEPRKNKMVLPRYTYPSSSQLRHTKKLTHLPGKIAWVLGACMLLKRDVYNQIAGFDEDFFLYGEDVDICLRLRLAGFEIGYADDILITHISGASEIGAASLDKWLRKRRGIFLFYQKHYDVKDQLNIAKKVIFKSKCYLLVLKLKAYFADINSDAYLDRKARLQATIIAAQELIDAQ